MGICRLSASLLISAFGRGCSSALNLGPGRSRESSILIPFDVGQRAVPAALFPSSSIHISALLLLPQQSCGGLGMKVFRAVCSVGLTAFVVSLHGAVPLSVKSEWEWFATAKNR